MQKKSVCVCGSGCTSCCNPIHIIVNLPKTTLYKHHSRLMRHWKSSPQMRQAIRPVSVARSLQDLHTWEGKVRWGGYKGYTECLPLTPSQQIRTGKRYIPKSLTRGGKNDTPPLFGGQRGVLHLRFLPLTSSPRTRLRVRNTDT
jgi:hypothetical protein